MISTPLSYESLKSPLYQMLNARTLTPRPSKYSWAFSVSDGPAVPRAARTDPARMQRHAPLVTSRVDMMSTVSLPARQNKGRHPPREEKSAGPAARRHPGVSRS